MSLDDTVSRMNAIRKKPMIVVCGCTGTGKTKLSIELAQWLISQNRKCEIINADAMQLYKNLDIATNKATQEEMQGVPHHLIGYLESTFIKNNVIDYRNKAVDLIDRLLEEDKIPILVGGTHYYIHSVLWDSLIDEKQKDLLSESVSEADLNQNDFKNNDSDPLVNLIKNSIKQTEKDDFTIRLHDSEISTEEMHKHLEHCDPQSAQTLHPNDRRKIIRALQIYYTYGCTKNEMLQAKNKQEGSGSFHGPLRYKSVCLFAMKCSDPEILNKRLDDRVEQMMKNGLLNEIESFKTEFDLKFPNQSFKEYSRDYQFGIFQSIGFKEFENFFKCTESEKQHLIEDGLKEMKLSTRRYAKYQIRWITNRFIKRANKYAPVVHELDTVDLNKWSENVLEKAKTIFEKYLNEIDSIQLQQDKPEQNNTIINELNKCDICDKIFVDKFQWECHLKGNKHKKRKDSLKRKEMFILADQIQTLKKLREDHADSK